MTTATQPGNPGLHAEERTFTETATAGVYTAEVPIPAGAYVIDVIFRNTVVWNAASSASAVIGDSEDANGYLEATDVKTAPAADTLGASTGASAAHSLLASIGAYKGGARKYYAAADTITATITTVGATGSTGRSRLLVLYVLPNIIAASKA
jgi:hypothetical protein